MKLTLFFSWHSTQTKYNKNFILSCIDKATKKISKTPEFKDAEFEVLEGVRGEPGSPQVAAKIIDERIPNCDVFIADLSVVNPEPRVSKVVNWFIRRKPKLFQNNNVIYEHGVATNAIGLERIVGVLNTEYGSPNGNPDNIPFDLRHIRFPIEYRYSERTNQSERERVQKELVNTLVTAIKDAGIFAQQARKNKYNPMSVWSDWEKATPSMEKFIKNDKIDELFQLILSELKSPKESIRILGLSGLGKTRMLLELFRPSLSDNDSIILSSRVLYINCNFHPNADLQSLFSKLNTDQEDRIVILDNCSKSIHRQLLTFVHRGNSKLTLISLDSNPEEVSHDRINNVKYFSIKKEELADVVDQILTRDFGNLGKDKIDKIKEFSQGIPLMAVLLGDSAKKGEQFIGKLDDKELLDKLLGPKGQEEKDRTILKSCAIFNYFGFYEELSTQIEFIAKNKNITSLNGDDRVLVNDFNETCQYFLKREIFEKRGRFIGMRPFPLAISLAQEWLTPCTPKRLMDTILDIAKLTEPDRSHLSEALAEQMRFLGYDDKANQILESIVGPNSPFDDAEVLNTELGSRLFRSFVQVNPVAVSQNIKRNFSGKTTDELLSVKAGRRNLVWTLEVLCFDKRTFADSVKILFAFALAENETWANNATGQLLHLFHIYLSGTEATLADRWAIIEWGLSLDDKRFNDLAIKAMSAALDYGNFGRSVGPERQGSKELRDNEPSVEEIKTYWHYILTKLTGFIEANNQYSQAAQNTIAGRIRSVVRARYARVIIPFLKRIVQVNNNNWDEGLQSLRLVKRFDAYALTENELAAVNDLIQSLTKTDFLTRYHDISRSYLNGYENSTTEKMIEGLISLADEFIQTKVSWQDSLPILYSSQQPFSHHFGKRIFQLIKSDATKVQEFVDLSLKTLLAIDKPNRYVIPLGGFIAEATPDVKEALYKKLHNSDELCYLLFFLLSIDPDGQRYFSMLFDIIDKDRSTISNFYNSRYDSLMTLSVDQLREFSSRLFSYGGEGYEVVFDLMYDLADNNEERKKSVYPIIKECVYRLGVGKTERNSFDHYKWFETISKIISDPSEGDLAKFVNASLIASITWQNSYNLDHDAQKLYSVLLTVHFTNVWPDLSRALLSADDEYIKFYGLKQILGSHIGGIGPAVGILFLGDTDQIFAWCGRNKPLAPARLAELVPIFDNNNTDYTHWHPVALRLLDEFGEINEVRSNLSANMGTYSWTGSIVPLLEAKKDLFNAISSHNKKDISDWAASYITYLDADIQREKNRDEESFLI
jgi:hypothetical protein